MLKEELNGSLAGKKLYRVTVHNSVYHRIVTLTNENVGTPDWLDLGPSPMLQHRIIAISDVEWLEPMVEE
jgi:hypothetical protein